MIINNSAKINNAQEDRTQIALKEVKKNWSKKIHQFFKL